MDPRCVVWRTGRLLASLGGVPIVPCQLAASLQCCYVNYAANLLLGNTRLYWSRRPRWVVKVQVRALQLKVSPENALQSAIKILNVKVHAVMLGQIMRCSGCATCNCCWQPAREVLLGEVK